MAEKTVTVDCVCKGRTSECVMCGGRGTRQMKACRRCEGTGDEGGKPCLDCRGQGFRDIDQLDPFLQ